MELLLNLVWLMLAVAVIWLWRRKPVSRKSRRFYCVHCVLSLGCILMLLSGDFSHRRSHALWQETEESSSSPAKRTVTQATGQRPQHALLPVG